ncbi:MAG: hypothetical protein ACOVP6_00995, partial [Lacibacter sp.]
MKNALLFLLFFLFTFTACKKKNDAPQTQTLQLQNDGFTTGGAKAFQAGFVVGETAEVTLGPVSNTFQVTAVQFLFGGTGAIPTSRDIVLKIYKDIGVGTPGTLLYTSTYSVAASDNLLQQIDLRDKLIVVNGGGSIRVAIEMTAAGLPSVAVDKDGTV